MTTIVYRDGVLASDAGVARAGTRLGSMVKIARDSAGRLAAGVGFAGGVQSFLTWFRDGAEGEPPICDSEDETEFWRGVVFYPDGSALYFERGDRYMVQAPYHALGTGADIALGALYMGASADDAVRAAMAFDEATFGQVHVLANRAHAEAAEAR